MGSTDFRWASELLLTPFFSRFNCNVCEHCTAIRVRKREEKSISKQLRINLRISLNLLLGPVATPGPLASQGWNRRPCANYICIGKFISPLEITHIWIHTHFIYVETGDTKWDNTFTLSNRDKTNSMGRQ